MNTNSAMNIFLCKKLNIDSNESVSFFVEDAYTLIYIISGKGNMIINNISEQIRANNIVCVKPLCKGKLKVSDGTLSAIYIHYFGGEADYLYKMSLFQKKCAICMAHNKEILFCFQNIAAEMKSVQANRYYLVAELLHIFSKFTPPIKVKESRRYQNRYLQRAIDLIQQNPSIPISVNLLAEQVNVDRSYLYRIFKKETGLSPWEYIIDYKLRLCEERIRKKNDNIQSIFNQLGFSSYYIAEKKFKEKYGMTPREYRKKKGSWEVNGKIKNC